MSPPTVRDVTPPPVLPALAPQLRDGASMGVAVRSATARPTPRLPASPHRVEGLRLVGVTPPRAAYVDSDTRNVAPTWAATRAGSDTSSPAIIDFMSLYDICVSSGHVARISVNHQPGYQDVTLHCRFPTQPTAANNRKRRRRRPRCPSAATTACAPLVPAATSTPTPAETPPPISPPAKRLRKRRCEVELLREGNEDSSLILTPPSYSHPSPSTPPSMPPSLSPYSRHPLTVHHSTSSGSPRSPSP
jgi:hypothetical protein